MGELYLKSGRTIRVEIETGTVHRLHLIEHGEASERDGVFECRTTAGPGQPLEKPDPVPEEIVRGLMELGPRCERATILSGLSRHSFEDGRGKRSWSDHTARLHVSIVNHDLRLRCEIERGGTRFDPSWIEDITAISDALARADRGPSTERELVLEPEISAALFATIVMSGRSVTTKPDQVPREGEIDGKGHRLKRCTIDSDDPRNLGWFRPSYRIRPRRLAHGIDLRSERDETAKTPSLRAVALAGRPRLEGSTLLVPCLGVTNHRATVIEVAISLDRWEEQVREVDDRTVWFPFLAGVWGRRLVVGPVRRI